MFRKAVVALVGAVVITAAALAVTAHGQAASKTIVFHIAAATRRDTKQIDLKPNGISPGDEFLNAATISQAGSPVGRAIGACTVIDVSYKGQACVFTLVTRQGQLTLAGGGEERRLPGTGGQPGPGDEFAITGGTGSYAGAAGTATVRSTSSGAATMTVTLAG
jgi:hypothetical protein